MKDVSPHEDDPIEELVLAYLDRTESDPASAPGVLADLCASAPEHASELRRRVEALVSRGLWSPSSAGETPHEIGDFRILERLGQGGMGVVFLAEQKSVGRRVALKLVRAEQLVLGNVRARFLREAQAVARLDHPGIVRVLTAGEHGGVPYLAMEYVEGCSLDVIVSALSGREPSQLSGADVRALLASRLHGDDARVPWNEEFFARGWTETCVRMVQSLAEALHHAHQRGVLHRDIKPSNVLLSPDGRVRLCDFGLAALEDSAKLTGSGAQLGTLAYMAPEQFRGESAKVTPATDVYALGITLYELLALRHPFVKPGENAVRMAVLDADAPPLRTRNRGVPADIEVICAKALERDPARRYPSAGDLARDLGHVLALRPIEARPPTFARRALKWTQRHPAAAVGTALGALLLLAGPVGWELSRMRSMDEVRTAYERSERDFRSALAAIGHVLRDTATDELEDVPRMQQARLVALDRALALFEELAAARLEDASVLDEGQELHGSRASVLGDLGRTTEANSEFARAVDYARRAEAASPSAARSARLAAALVAYGKSFSALGETAKGLASIEEGIALWRKQEDSAAASGFTQALLAHAEALVILGRNEDARRPAIEAVERAEEATRRDSSDPLPHWSRGRGLGWLTAIEERASRQEEAREHALAALAAFERAAQLDPASRFYAFDIAEAEVDAADPHFELGETEAAARFLRSAIARVDLLLRDFPDSVRYRNMRSTALEKLAVHSARSGDVRGALALQRELVTERERELAVQPERCDLRMRASLALTNLAASLTGLGEELDAALACYARIEALLATCNTDRLALDDVGNLISNGRYGNALALLGAGRMDDAFRAIESHAATVGTSAERLRYAADLWNELALAQRRKGDDETRSVERMFALLGEAVERGYHVRAELESTPALESFRSDPRFAAILARIPAD